MKKIIHASFAIITFLSVAVLSSCDSTSGGFGEHSGHSNQQFQYQQQSESQHPD